MPSLYDLEQILNSIPDPIFVKDRAHRWVLLNDACCRFIGFERSLLIGKSDYDFFPKGEADIFWEKDELVFNTGQMNENDEQFTDVTGERHFITTKKMLYVSPAGERFIVGCIRDFTEQNRMQQELKRAREELEQKVYERTLELAAMNQALTTQIADHGRISEQLRQSQKMEAIGQLAGGIAHDFNNLLNVIIGYGSLIERSSGTDAKLQDMAQNVIDAAEAAASLTRQLLAFSRKQVLQPEILEVNDLIRSTGKMLRRLIGEHINLDIKIAQDAGCVRVDRGQFEQVIINLAVNARDAMPAGGRLSIETAPVPVFSNNADGSEASTQEAVSVTVTDTGTGMSPDVMAHIFEPFFTTKEQGKGTGLGLATVYGIVMQSNGRINVSSEPGIGTRFVITLPKAEKQLQGSQQPTRVDPQRGSETVLLVEDQSELRTLLRQVLESQGYSVLEASSGAEALAFGQSRSDIDLLITDIVMPGMRGWELAHKLSSQSNLKVLYMSGHSDTDLINEGAMLGGGIFLEKPFRPESILAKVREILGPADPSAARTQKAG